MLYYVLIYCAVIWAVMGVGATCWPALWRMVVGGPDQPWYWRIYTVALAPLALVAGVVAVVGILGFVVWAVPPDLAGRVWRRASNTNPEQAAAAIAAHNSRPMGEFGMLRYSTQQAAEHNARVRASGNAMTTESEARRAWKKLRGDWYEDRR